jgi:hypothetical protein
MPDAVQSRLYDVRPTTARQPHTSSTSAPDNRVLQLQQTAGNRAVTALLASGIHRQVAAPAQLPPLPTAPRGTAPQPGKWKRWETWGQRYREQQAAKGYGFQPLATVVRGGEPPTFITEQEQASSISMASGEQRSYHQRQFHMLSALDWSVMQASGPGDTDVILLWYFGVAPKTPNRIGQITIPKPPVAVAEMNREDPGAKLRAKTFTEATRRKRRRGRRDCSDDWTPRLGGDPIHNAYCDHIFPRIGDPLRARYDYELHGPEGVVSFDHYNEETSQYFDGKTRHQLLAVEWWHAWPLMLATMLDRAMRQQAALRACPPPFYRPRARLIWVFDDPAVAKVAKQLIAGAGAVDDVWFEPGPNTGGRSSRKRRKARR